jgi:hypothetical protein
VIKPKAAIARMEGDYGYVRLPGFNEKATDALTASINDLKAKNPQMKGLIFDLRNNPGGLLDQAVGVSDVFLDGGEVVSQRGRDPRDIQRYNAKPGDLLNGLPVVVLINQGSASAAEIVAGALQDRHRAELVGITSFGKGSVQTVIPLRGGADGALKLTTARYFTPSGRSIQKTGIAARPGSGPDQGPGPGHRQPRVVQRGQLQERAERRRGQEPPGRPHPRRGAADRLRREEGRLPAAARHRRAEGRLGRGRAEAAQAGRPRSPRSPPRPPPRPARARRSRRSRILFLLPLREKVACEAGRMRGLSSDAIRRVQPDRWARRFRSSTPHPTHLLRTTPSSARGEGIRTDIPPHPSLTICSALPA